MRLSSLFQHSDASGLNVDTCVCIYYCIQVYFYDRNNVRTLLAHMLHFSPHVGPTSLDFIPIPYNILENPSFVQLSIENSLGFFIQ